jgi:hypothetical protein
MADADAQPVEPGMAEQADGVAQAVLAAVATIELQARGAGRQVELVVRELFPIMTEAVEAWTRGGIKSALDVQSRASSRP